MDEHRRKSIEIGCSSKQSGKRRDGKTEDLSRYSLPKLLGDSSLNPDVCLTRVDKLKQDQNKKFSSLFSSRSPRDISHILDGPTPRKTRKIISFSEIKKWLHQNKPRHPTSLKEIETIQKWLTETTQDELPELESVLSSSQNPSKAFVEKFEAVYTLALNELLRQVSVQCKSRAELLKKVIETLSAVWKKYPDYLLFKIETEIKKKNNEIENLELNNRVGVQAFKETIFNLEQKLENQLNENKKKQEEIGRLKETIEGLNWEYEEFIIYKTRKFKAESVSVQTEEDQILNLPEQPSITESSNSLSDNSLITFQIPNKDQISDKINTEEEAKQKFKEDLQLLFEELDRPDCNLKKITETAINESRDLESWLCGFKSALNLSLKPENLIKTEVLSNDQVSRKKGKSMNVDTKFKTPLVTRKNTLRSGNDSVIITPKESSAVFNVIAGITSQPISKITKNVKSSQKKISNHISHCVLVAIIKYSKTVNFSEFVFTKFIEKYNIKSLAERKFQELVKGCYLYCNENTKFKWFLRALRAGQGPDLSDLSREMTEMLIRLYEFMIQSRVGVIADMPNPLQNKEFPYLRALECIKSKFELVFSKQDYSSLVDQLNKLVVIDPSAVNRGGLVNLDKFINVSMEAYEVYVNKITTGVNYCLNIITEYHYLSKGIACLILRHLSSTKYSVILKSLIFDEQGLIDKEAFLEACIYNGALSHSSVSEFFSSSSYTSKEVLKRLESAELQVVNLAKQTEESLTADEWENYFFDLRIKLKLKDPRKPLQLWHVLQKEIDFLIATHE